MHPKFAPQTGHVFGPAVVTADGALGSPVFTAIAPLVALLGRATQSPARTKSCEFDIQFERGRA